MCNEFRFFTLLRCVQNDREWALRSEGQNKPTFQV